MRVVMNGWPGYHFVNFGSNIVRSAPLEGLTCDVAENRALVFDVVDLLELDDYHALASFSPPHHQRWECMCKQTLILPQHLQRIYPSLS